MTTLLLESNHKANRSLASAVPSVMLHTCLILLAIQLTSHAGISQRSSQQTRPVTLYPPPAQLPGASRGKMRTPRAVDAIPASLPGSLDPASVVIPTTTIGSVLAPDLPGAPVSARDFQNESGTAAQAGEILFVDYQPERNAAATPGSPAPEYPEALRAARVQGTVWAAFVVDTTGRVDITSVWMIRSDDHRLDGAVAKALVRARFTPAEVGGRKIRQLVQQPFSFTIR